MLTSAKIPQIVKSFCVFFCKFKAVIRNVLHNIADFFVFAERDKFLCSDGQNIIVKVKIRAVKRRGIPRSEKHIKSPRAAEAVNGEIVRAKQWLPKRPASRKAEKLLIVYGGRRIFRHLVSPAVVFSRREQTLAFFPLRLRKISRRSEKLRRKRRDVSRRSAHHFPETKKYLLFCRFYVQIKPRRFFDRIRIARLRNMHGVTRKSRFDLGRAGTYRPGAGKKFSLFKPGSQMNGKRSVRLETFVLVSPLRAEKRT